MSMHRPGQPSSGEDHGFPTKQLATLAICRLAEPIAFTSILSYTYAMVQTFPGITTNTASFYAGLLISAFAVAEACTAMFWGSISDRYGRKPIILLGLAGTALSSLVFGFATNFWMAFAARIVGGALNGNVAVLQTMVTEIATRPEHEPRAYAMPAFMWSFGAIIGAAMGGYFAEPARYYPSLFSSDGLFGQYPYLLPNLVAVVAIILAIAQGYVFLEETNPRLRAQVRQVERSCEQNNPADEQTPLLSRERRLSLVDPTNSGLQQTSFLERSVSTSSDPDIHTIQSCNEATHNPQCLQTSGGEAETDIEDGQKPADVPIKAFNRPVILWVIAIVTMSYHQMAFSSLLPTYLLSTPHTSTSLDFRGGLGYTVHDVGLVMSINGIIALSIQIFIFPPFVRHIGIRNSLVWLITLCPITYILVPFLSILPHSTLPFGIYALLSTQNFFMIIIYPCLLISLKNATPSPLVLGRVNGLAMSACSGARTIAPPLAGWIYGRVGAAAAWWSIGVVAVMGVGQFWLLERLSGEVDGAGVNKFKGEASQEGLQVDGLDEGSRA